MAQQTTIEWATNADGSKGATWNPIRARDRETGLIGTHCVHVSPGCVNCFAEAHNARKLPHAGTGLPYTAQSTARVEIYLDEAMLRAPLRRAAPTVYFLTSMSDAFGEFVSDDQIDQLFAVMALCPQHTFIVLTKRSARMRAWFAKHAVLAKAHGDRMDSTPAHFDAIAATLTGDPNAGAHRPWPLPNVWLVVSCEDQQRADERIPDLLATPAAVRGVSLEPLLGWIDLSFIVPPGTTRVHYALKGVSFDPMDASGGEITTPTAKLDWVIAGGESGPSARPMHPAWIRALRDQCAAAGVPFFFKQWGVWSPYDGARVPPMITIDEGFGPVRMYRVGKHRAGRTLDGRQHVERPPVPTAEEAAAIARIARKFA